MSGTSTLQRSIGEDYHGIEQKKREGIWYGLIATVNDRSVTLLRVTLAVVMFPHGAQKLLGWFGGYGFEGTMGFFTEVIGLPYPLGVLTILLEFFGPIALLFGFMSRGIAAGFGFIMIGAIFTTHLQNGFLMNWEGTQAGEGIEFHLLILAISIVLVIKGSGAYSVDKVFSDRDEIDEEDRGI